MLDTIEMKLETILRQLLPYPSSQYLRQVINGSIFTRTPYPQANLHLIILHPKLELFTITLVTVNNSRSHTDSTLIICCNAININLTTF